MAFQLSRIFVFLITFCHRSLHPTAQTARCGCTGLQDSPDWPGDTDSPD
jgi:hypothetical protein